MDTQAVVAIAGSAVGVVGSVGAGAKWLFGKVVDYVEKREAKCDEKLETLGKRLDECQDRHNATDSILSEIADRLGDDSLASRARSLTPKDTPLQRPREGKETWGDIV